MTQDKCHSCQNMEALTNSCVVNLSVQCCNSMYLSGNAIISRVCSTAYTPLRHLIKKLMNEGVCIEITYTAVDILMTGFTYINPTLNIFSIMTSFKFHPLLSNVRVNVNKLLLFHH